MDSQKIIFIRRQLETFPIEHMIPKQFSFNYLTPYFCIYCSGLGGGGGWAEDTGLKAVRRPQAWNLPQLEQLT
jgi:hypothetical protein